MKISPWPRTVSQTEVHGILQCLGYNVTKLYKPEGQKSYTDAELQIIHLGKKVTFGITDWFSKKKGKGMRIKDGPLHAYVRSNPNVLFDATALFLSLLRCHHTCLLDNVVEGTLSTRSPSATSSASGDSEKASEEGIGEHLPEYDRSREPERPSEVPLRATLLGGSDDGLISTTEEDASDGEWIPVEPPPLDNAQGTFWTVAE